MSKKIKLGIIIIILFLTPSLAQAATEIKQEFSKAVVTKILDEGKRKVGNMENIYQKVVLKFIDGSEKDKEITLEHGGMFAITAAQKVKPNDVVIVSKSFQENQTQYALVDIFRLDKLLYILLGFFFLIIIISGKKGLGSMAGLLLSIGVIFFFIVPQIINGANPLFISIIGSLFIMITSIYLAHGFSQQTTVAVVSTFICLILTLITAILSVQIMHLSGMGSEDAYTLYQGFQGRINFQGLLLGAIIIGALGVLDDVTTTQSATVYTLSEANSAFTVRQLIKQGMRIGREHIVSLVNTLVLAYAGASIGVFIYLILGMRQGIQPLWVMLNNELITEELIRTIAGSVGLILAVPITTIIASFFAKYSVKIH